MDNGNHPANSDTVIPLTGRRPGRPKGLPKPPNSGRQKGVRNHVSRDVKELALRDAPKMLAGLKKLALEATDERTRLAAITAYLDRAYGRPVQATELTGKDGEPLVETAMDSRERAKRFLALLARARADGINPLNVPDLRDDVKEVAFAAALAERQMADEREREDAAKGTLVLGPEHMVPINRQAKPEPAPIVAPAHEPQPARQWPTPDEAELLRAQRQEDRALSGGHAPRVITGGFRR